MVLLSFSNKVAANIKTIESSIRKVSEVKNTDADDGMFLSAENGEINVSFTKGGF